MKKLLVILLVLCILFPAIRALTVSGLITFVPVAEAFMPCLIAIAGIYILIKAVFK